MKTQYTNKQLTNNWMIFQKFFRKDFWSYEQFKSMTNQEKLDYLRAIGIIGKDK